MGGANRRVGYFVLASALAACGVDSRAVQTLEIPNAPGSSAGVSGSPETSILDSTLGLDPEELNLGSLTIGSSANVPLTISNTGAAELPIPILSLVGANPSDFSIGANLCDSVLAPAGSCTASVAFAPSAIGERTASVLVQAGRDVTRTVRLRGVGLQPGALAGNAAQLDFGGVEISAPAEAQSWTITNTGGVASGPLSLSSDNEAEFPVENSCSGELAPGASCTIRVSFQSGATGPHWGSLTLSSPNAGALGLSVKASVVVRVSVERVGTPLGRVVMDGRGGHIDCGDVCTTLIDAKVNDLAAFEVQNDPEALMVRVELEGLEPQGLYSNFGGTIQDDRQSIGMCCALRHSGTLRFHFQPAANLVFVSSETFPATLGSAAAYDQRCNDLATRAKLNVPSNDGFIAAVWDANSSPADRLRPGVQGWMRLDGLPFATTREALFGSEGSLAPVVYNDKHQGYNSQVMTGLSEAGTATETCGGWTGAGNVSLADPLAAGPFWSAGKSAACDSLYPLPVICLGNTKTAPLSVPASAGRRIWVTRSEFTPGTGTPDGACAAERPAGVGEALALVDTAGRIAADLLATDQFIRTDGMLVLGPALDPRVTQFSRVMLPGPWLTADGSPLEGTNQRAWEGSYCFDWTQPAMDGRGGTVDLYSSRAHVALPRSGRDQVGSVNDLPCSSSAHLLCVEM